MSKKITEQLKKISLMLDQENGMYENIKTEAEISTDIVILTHNVTVIILTLLIVTCYSLGKFPFFVGLALLTILALGGRSLLRDFIKKKNQKVEAEILFINNKLIAKVISLIKEEFDITNISVSDLQHLVWLSKKPSNTIEDKENEVSFYLKSLNTSDSSETGYMGTKLDMRMSKTEFEVEKAPVKKTVVKKAITTRKPRAKKTTTATSVKKLLKTTEKSTETAVTETPKKVAVTKPTVSRTTSPKTSVKKVVKDTKSTPRKPAVKRAATTTAKTPIKPTELKDDKVSSTSAKTSAKIVKKTPITKPRAKRATSVKKPTTTTKKETTSIATTKPKAPRKTPVKKPTTTTKKD